MKKLTQKVENTQQEALSETDQKWVDNTKLKMELAQSNVKNALIQNENAELTHNNTILQLALKYGLQEGDVITENGTIQRKQKKEGQNA